VSARHNDPQSFDDAIVRWRAQGGTGRPWIAVESLYSMDGDRAPLAELAALAERHEGMLVIDEAHATGVLGPDGRGLGASLEGRPDVVSLHTCGKALGVMGGLVALSATLSDYLVNRCRPFIYATAPSPLMAAAVRAALVLVAKGGERRERLDRLVAFTGREIRARCGLPASSSHILPVILGPDDRAMGVARTLQERGFDVRAVRPPTVPEGTARLRISLTLNATEADVGNMLDVLAGALARVPA
jgi:8-amino-7-oxononanoate synthase